MGKTYVTDGLWQTLEHLSYVDQAIADGEQGWDELVTEARRFTNYADTVPGARGTRRRSTREEIEPPLDRLAAARVAACRAYHAAIGTPVPPLIAPKGRASFSYGTVLGEANGETTYNSATIKLAIPAWLPADAVYRIYRDMQRDVLAQRDTTRKHRAISEKTLALFQFCLPRVKVSGGPDNPKRSRRARDEARTSWRAIMEEWNTAQTDPSWCYKDYRTCYHDYHRAKETVAWPIREADLELQPAPTEPDSEQVQSEKVLG